MKHAALLELDPALRDLAEAELRGDERVAWAGQPVFRWLSAGVLVPTLFAVPFTGFAVFWIVGAAYVTSTSPAGRGPWSLFPLFGIPFVLIGFGLFTTPYWLARSMRRTVYLVTDRRAIVLGGRLFGGTRSRSFEPDQVARMERNERGDGSGDLIFEVRTQRRGTDVSTVRHGFLSVARVREVEDVLRRTLLEGRTRAV